MAPTDDNFAQAVKELRGPVTSAAKAPEPKEPKPRKPKKSKGKKKVAAAPAALKSVTGQAGLPAEIEEVDEIDEKQLKTLQESLSHLSKKAIRKLKKLLDSDNARVQMQTALGVIRTTVQALTRIRPPRAPAQKFTSIPRRSPLSSPAHPRPRPRVRRSPASFSQPGAPGSRSPSSNKNEGVY